MGAVCDSLLNSFTDLAKLTTAISYLFGLGFSVVALLKFKQHKDNPTQMTIGVPISYLFISSALLFLPTFLGITGMTIFGSAAKTAGPFGVVFQ